MKAFFTCCAFDAIDWFFFFLHSTVSCIVCDLCIQWINSQRRRRRENPISFAFSSTRNAHTTRPSTWKWTNECVQTENKHKKNTHPEKFEWKPRDATKNRAKEFNTLRRRKAGDDDISLYLDKSRPTRKKKANKQKQEKWFAYSDLVSFSLFPMDIINYMRNSWALR